MSFSDFSLTRTLVPTQTQVGPLMNFNNFFMCGVPGGLDYAMLFAVKHGWMSPLQEKK